MVIVFIGLLYFIYSKSSQKQTIITKESKSTQTDPVLFRDISVIKPITKYHEMSNNLPSSSIKQNDKSLFVNEYQELLTIDLQSSELKHISSDLLFESIEITSTHSV